ncbi:MAG TPA: hypothetical protein VLX28_06810, partial [Thermoanaerobaculia bacterium]|nr:hypothetical protein [Thermoanaerobaculia bacterium]
AGQAPQRRNAGSRPAPEVLLLLDGLDEVRELKHRNLVVERVKDFYSLHRGAGNKFVMTSRVVGYREVRPAAEGLAEATLVDFDNEEIKAFVEKWTAAIEKAAAGETQAAREDACREREELLAAVQPDQNYYTGDLYDDERFYGPRRRKRGLFGR